MSTAPKYFYEEVTYTPDKDGISSRDEFPHYQGFDAEKAQAAYGDDCDHISRGWRAELRRCPLSEEFWSEIQIDEADIDKVVAYVEKLNGKADYYTPTDEEEEIAEKWEEIYSNILVWGYDDISTCDG